MAGDAWEGHVNPTNLTIVRSLRALGADFSECWHGLMDLGHSRVQSWRVVHSAFQDPYVTICETCEALDKGYEDWTWLPEALESIGISPISLAVSTPFREVAMARIERTGWTLPIDWQQLRFNTEMETPIHGTQCVEADLRSLHEDRWVIPAQLEFIGCIFNEAAPPTRCETLKLIGGSGLKRASDIELSPSTHETLLHLEHLAEIQTIDVRGMIGGLQIECCPCLSLPQNLQPSWFSLQGHPTLRDLPDWVARCDDLAIVDCPQLILPARVEAQGIHLQGSMVPQPCPERDSTLPWASAIFAGCDGLALPQEIAASASLYFEAIPLGELPRNMRTRLLDIVDCSGEILSGQVEFMHMTLRDLQQLREFQMLLIPAEGAEIQVMACPQLHLGATLQGVPVYCLT